MQRFLSEKMAKHTSSLYLSRLLVFYQHTLSFVLFSEKLSSLNTIISFTCYEQLWVVRLTWHLR